ncbi:hypothetical protein Tco_1512702, partial [Tanacetum coccineum]
EDLINDGGSLLLIGNKGAIGEATRKEYVERVDIGVVMILKTSSFYVEQGGQETGGILTIEDLRNYKVNVMDVLAVSGIQTPSSG